MKKKKLSYTVALWWIILCAVLGLFLLAAGRKDSRLSETENRMLAGFPALTPRTLLSGEFMSGFDAYLSDAFFGRDRVIALTNRLVDGFSALSADERLAMASENMENRLAAEGDLQAERKDGESEPDSSEQDATAPSESSRRPLSSSTRTPSRPTSRTPTSRTIRPRAPSLSPTSTVTSGWSRRTAATSSSTPMTTRISPPTPRPCA
ncbi:MAG: hypothetical protein IJJ23_07660 [Clostridia bacterium]|nr:hypothetical protein [Clostridia bacterium]